MYCRLQISKSYRKASLIKQLVSKVDRLVTVTQEWLESEDKLPSKVVGHGVIVMALLFMVGQVVRY